MITIYSRFDTPCIFTRELNHLKLALESWFPRNASASASTIKSYGIVYPLDYLPVANQEQMDLLNGFLRDATIHLPACTVKQLSIRKTWASTHPEGTPDSADEYLDDLVAQTYYYAFYHSSDEFRRVYSEKRGGKMPYVIPFVHRRWAKGAAVSDSQHREATAKMDVYKEWILRTIFYQIESSRSSTIADNEKTSNRKQVFILLLISNVTPNYRHVASPSPENQSALDELFLPSILGAPDIAVPIGDVPYQSRITGLTEHLPVLANLVAAPGNDWGLIAAVERILALWGRPAVVKTGHRMF